MYDDISIVRVDSEIVITRGSCVLSFHRDVAKSLGRFVINKTKNFSCVKMSRRPACEIIVHWADSLLNLKSCNWKDERDIYGLLARHHLGKAHGDFYIVVNTWQKDELGLLREGNILWYGSGWRKDTETFGHRIIKAVE